jgi:phosphoribosylanthranilate isomerase
MTRIKICGLTRPEEIDVVNSELPDYIGFVFAESRRKVDEDTARRLKRQLDSRILTIGIFVNEDIRRIAELCNQGTIDLIQLHGDEDHNYIMTLKNTVPNPIVKALRVVSQSQIIEAEELPCDYLLLDTYTRGQYGGSGMTFDWSIIPVINKPYFLAGGLKPNNIEDALSKCTPYAVDVSSGVELNGMKNSQLIRNIIRTVRGDG